jgi:PKD repeat protein
MVQTALRTALLACAAISAACTVNGTDVPSLTGPSEAALSLNLTVTPDMIDHDGRSQATITVSAFDVNGKAISGQAFRLDMALDGVTQDYGLLSLRTITTGADGRASAVYTAPPPPSAQTAGTMMIVTLIATPLGANFDTSSRRTATLRLNPVGVVRPPAIPPTPSFRYSPTTVLASVPAVFDASESCATTSPCGSTEGIVSFEWNFGDGSTGSGEVVSHAFPAAGSYSVRLTVTNDRGLSRSAIKDVTVVFAQPPTASFIVTPSPYRAGAPLFFNADQSLAAPGRTIVTYAWNFGDGTAGSGQNVAHTYAAVGTYTVVLTVVDDIGRRATSTAGVTVVP